MEEHKAVVEAVVLADGAHDLYPVGGRHVARIDRCERDVVDVEVELAHLRHVVDEVGEVERFETPCRGVLDHADGTTGIDDQYAGAMCGLHGVGLCHFTCDPGLTAPVGPITTSLPPADAAESIMPCDSIPLSLRGGRLAMKHTCLPTSSSGA